ncbi:MAG: methanogenesis marker 2 protein [Candidatus Verstraetearchaeota archaeon]|nr:methanogenesis marker 2 protein [Candidatus Verstraetearchaeota archaeon]
MLQESLQQITEELRKFRGLSRKSCIGDILKVFGEREFDDAGFLDIDDFYIVVSTDGITEDLVKADPWLAGYYSVLVNVNDVVVKGAKPLGYVNVVSSPNSQTRLMIAKGIEAALKKYGLKLLKGHTHPDTSYEAIDAAVIGVAKRIARSSTAKPGDSILLAVDLDGSFGQKGWVKCFDSTQHKSPEELRQMLFTVIDVVESSLVTASRDVSAPGIIGSIAMLCESSNVGASINLEAVPKPENTSIVDWLTAYPALGFIFTTSKARECLRLLESKGYHVSVIGEVNNTKKITLQYRGESEIFADLNTESIFGFRKPIHPCLP